jgi:hypothetical protein
MAKDGIEQLMLRTCTAGNVTLSWNSDKVGLFTDPACEQQHKVAEDEGSLEGSRRATFTPQYATPPNKGNWDTVFKTTRLCAKALETSAIMGDIHLTPSPVSGKCPSDLINATIVGVDAEGHRPGTMASPGAAVPEADEEESANLVAMVNDDNEDGGPPGQRDNRDTVIGANDNDIVLLTLNPPMPETLKTGVIHLAIAPVDSVEVFKGDGSALLTDYSVNLAAPEGDLAGLADGPVNIFLEGMSPHANTVVRLSYDNWQGVERASDLLFVTILKVQASHIAFNHDWDSHTSDGLNIRQNKTLTIPIPEYTKGGNNQAAAYIKDKSITMLARFTAEPSSFVTSLKLKGVSDDTDGSLGDVVEKIVSFEAGVSTEGTDDPATPGFDESEYAELQVSGKTPDKVFVSNDSWNWTITEVNGVPTPPLLADRSGEHRIYTVFDEPKSPWVLNPHDDEKNPWDQVLSYACDWANGAQNEDAAMGSVTTGAYGGFGKDYNGDITHVEGTTCHLTSLLSDTKADCQDMSAVVQLYTAILGGGTAQVRRVNGPFNTKEILPMQGTWTTEYWYLHQFGWKGNVYDACLKLKQTDPRVPVNEDLDTTYKNDLFDSGTWSPQLQSKITDFD